MTSKTVPDYDEYLRKVNSGEAVVTLTLASPFSAVVDDEWLLVDARHLDGNQPAPVVRLRLKLDDLSNLQATITEALTAPARRTMN